MPRRTRSGRRSTIRRRPARSSPRSGSVRPLPAWPAAATTRPARARLGLLREDARVESLEARPDSRFRVRVTASGFDSEWSWRLEPVAGGTRVIHAATFEPFDRWTGILVRLGRAILASRVEAHLRVLKERAEAAQRSANPVT